MSEESQKFDRDFMKEVKKWNEEKEREYVLDYQYYCQEEYVLDYQYYCQECGHLRDYCDCDIGVD